MVPMLGPRGVRANTRRSGHSSRPSSPTGSRRRPTPAPRPPSRRHNPRKRARARAFQGRHRDGGLARAAAPIDSTRTAPTATAVWDETSNGITRTRGAEDLACIMPPVHAMTAWLWLHRLLLALATLFASLVLVGARSWLSASCTQRYVAPSRRRKPVPRNRHAIDDAAQLSYAGEDAQHSAAGVSDVNSAAKRTRYSGESNVRTYGLHVNATQRSCVGVDARRSCAGVAAQRNRAGVAAQHSSAGVAAARNFAGEDAPAYARGSISTFASRQRDEHASRTCAPACRFGAGEDPAHCAVFPFQRYTRRMMIGATQFVPSVVLRSPARYHTSQPHTTRG